MKLVFTDQKDPHAAPYAAVRRRVEGGRAVRVYPGAYLDAGHAHVAAITPELRHVALALSATRIGTHGVISGLSAAVLHGLPVRKALIPNRLCVTRSWNGAESQWVQPRRSHIPEADVAEILGMRVTSPRRTVSDLADVLGPHDLLAAADHALRLGCSLSNISERKRHRGLLRWVETHASARAESAGESWSRATLIEHGFDPGEHQVDVFNTAGQFVARVDFLFDGRVVGEFDGRVKYGSLLAPDEDAADVVMREKRREHALRSLGFDVVRWDWKALHDPLDFTSRLRRALERADQLPRPAGTTRLASVGLAQPPDWDAVLDLSALHRWRRAYPTAG